MFNYDSGIYKTINDEIKLCLIELCRANGAMYKTAMHRAMYRAMYKTADV